MKHLSPSLMRFLVIGLLLATILPPAAGLAAPTTQTPSPTTQAQAVLNQLTPEERIGQLFLLTFKDNKVGSGTMIADLITNRFIGGVVLLAANDNIPDGNQTVNQVFTLVRQLQLVRRSTSQSSKINPANGEPFTPAYIPLFISIPQEGDGYAYDQILSGLTPLPNEMALGATWNPALSTQVGSVLGKELSILGINLLLGPSLDVLENPRQEGANDLGTRSFGGDPFWVAEMGKAFIQGVHEGSQGQIAVVAKHFPGQGGSDRLPDEEVATVRKSLEELESFELAPFFAVTGNAPSPAMTADALLTSHIRYQGFQGNIRATTRPVSFDPQALNLLLSLPPIDSWRKAGGLVISDDLGNRAVRRFYDPTGQSFDPRRVALNAFLAGNDVLYFGDFSSPSESDPYTSTLHTLDFFTQKYREDTAFAQRVDESVTRILTLKFRLYGEFSLNNVLPPSTRIRDVGQSGQATFETARQSATLISPPQNELDDSLPDPPGPDDNLVFITDDQTGQQCTTCQPYALLPVDSLEKVVLKRYGPLAGSQVSPKNLSSYPLSLLKNMLDGMPEGSQLETALKRSDWIIFSLLKPSNEQPSFLILSRFLAERPDLFQQKRLIVYSMNAPYYLDATNISKLSAYYGLYSKMPQFVDIAAYLLFKELQPIGASPVSIPGIRYDLNAALFPDPKQIIPLEFDLPVTEAISGTKTPIPTVVPKFGPGDVIAVRTGIIYDHNGFTVPDGIPVDFTMRSNTNTTELRQTGTTQAGVARASFNVVNYGLFDISAESETAKSTVLQVDVPAPGEEPPSPTPTTPPTPTPSPTLTATPTPTPEVKPPVSLPPTPNFGDWIMALLMTVGIGWSAYRLFSIIGPARWGARAGLLAVIGGLLAYCYLILQLPGSEYLLKTSVSRGVFVTTLAGIITGLLVAWLWQSISSPKN